MKPTCFGRKTNLFDVFERGQTDVFCDGGGLKVCDFRFLSGYHDLVEEQQGRFKDAISSVKCHCHALIKVSGNQEMRKRSYTEFPLD